MRLEWLRNFCLTFPLVQEQVQWENALVFKVGGKMFLVMRLEPSAVACSFKCSPEMFAELVERPGVIPAPYLARASWVGLEDSDALSAMELKQLVRRSYEMVREKLPKKTRLGLEVARPTQVKRQRVKRPRARDAAKRSPADFLAAD